METSSLKTCCGCLNNGRRMVVINGTDLQTSFSLIINENQMSTSELELCFECEALLRRFTVFRIQVAACYNTLHKYAQQVTKPVTRLGTHKVQYIDVTNWFPPSDEPAALLVDVKTEADDDEGEYLNDEPPYQEDVIIEKPFIKRKKKKKKPAVKLEKDPEVEFTKVKLSDKEIAQERELLALKDDYVNAMFTCDGCIVTFPNEDDLKDHIYVKHDMYASQYKCSVCSCTFRSEVSYNYHTNKHYRRYQCVVCADRFHSKPAAGKHYSMAHCHGAEYELDENNYDVTVASVKDAEDKDDSGQEKHTFPCQYCAKVFKWRTSLRKHVEKHRIETGEKRTPYCEPCRLSFTSTPNLQKHVRTSSKHKIQLALRKVNGVEANGTQKSASKQKSQMMDEIKSSVNKSQPKFNCQQCDKVFLWRGNLMRHLRSHAAKAKGDLVCKPCNRSFSSIATYQQHMKISKKHVSENDFKYMCSDCGKRFAIKLHLRDHINWEHLKNYVYSCDECQKVFKTRNSVYLHKQAVHMKDSLEHLCDHCGKPFPNNAKLRSHILGIHSGGVQYQCALCDARFSWKSCLSRHVRLKHRKRADRAREQ
ncbi:zinc finger protein 845 [Bicyclus anynana]|uniref:Zinc finger protein 845 n=1 Tax=Bicyclus anynana TaxID=110368 RepID=A0ABM3M4D6_BICAN|nr:zinc finger protein 845 [Bicyclus anynana]